MKKKITLLKVFMTLCLLLVSFGNAWGETYSMTIDSSNNGKNDVHWTGSGTTSLTHNNITWSTSVVGTTSFTAQTTYCQIGSKNYPATKVTISTTGFAGKKITKVAVTCYCMSNTGPKLTVTAGSTTMINNVDLVKTTSTEMKSVDGTSATLGTSDNLTIEFTSSAKAAIAISKIEVTYEEAKTLDHISVSGTPKDFFVGDKFNHDGMTVTAYYDDETNEDVTASATFSTPDMTTAGEKDVTVTYGDKEASYKINVQAVVLTSVVVSGTPTKKEYFVGESFNPAGLTVTGHYNNGTQATITEGITWTITPETFTETTQNSVSVTATVGNITSGAYEVTGLTVTSPASLYTLTAEPAEGGSYTVTVGEDPAVEVTADAKQFMVTEGTVIVVEATANEHYKVHSTPFEGKYADETPIIFDNTGVAKKKQFTYETADATITAKFLQMYAVNIDENIEHGNVVADPVENTPTSFITLTLTPDAHYHFESVTVKDKNGGDIALEGEPITTEEGITTAKFRMPAAEDTKGAVSVTATFAEDAKYTVTFSVNGENTTSDANYAGEPVEFPTVSPIAGYTFMGWTDAPIIGTQQTAPEYVTGATYPDNNDAVFYAVFAKKEGEDKYAKVTSQLSDWRGNYLIAYSDEVFMDGSLAGGKDGVGKAQSHVAPGDALSEDKSTVSAAWGDEHYVTIEAIKDEDLSKGYVIKSHSKTTPYFYQTSNSNGMAATGNKDTAAEYPITITFNNASDIDIALGGGAAGAVLHYNSNSGSTGEMFRYYKDGGQKNIYLYKKQEATYSNYTTTVTTTATMSITSAKWSTFIAPFDVEIPEGVEAYTVTATEDALVYTPVETTITACTPVVLFKDVTETYEQDFVGVDNAEERTFQTESLVGTLDALAKGEVPTTTESDVPVYLLQKQNEKVGFFKLDPTKQYSLNANRAYLVGVATASAKAYYGFDDNDPTGINNLRGEQWNVPREGIFDLSGRKLSAPQKGVNIINGIKVIVK